MVRQYFLIGSCVVLSLVLSVAAFATGLETAKNAVLIAEKGNYGLAIGQFEMALRANDMDQAQQAKTYYNLGTAYLLAGRPDLALSPLMQATVLNKEDVRAWANLTDAHWRMGAFDKARGTLKKAQELKEDLSVLFYFDGVLLLQRGSAQKALEALKEAVSKERHNLEYQLGYGRALVATHAYDNAVKVFTGIIKQDPWSAYAYLYRSTALRGLGKHDLGRADLLTAATIAPDDAAVREVYKQMRWPERKRDIRKVISKVQTHTGPKNTSPIMVQLQNTQQVEVSACVNGWCRIEADGHLAGYVEGNKLKPL